MRPPRVPLQSARARSPPGVPPQPPLPTTGECEYQPDTIYEQAADGWQQRIETTSAGQCCAICRSLPECFVANYQLTPQAAPTDLQSACILNGKTDLSRPTHKPNATACVVKTRPPPPAPAPAGAMNVLYFVSGNPRALSVRAFGKLSQV